MIGKPQFSKRKLVYGVGINDYPEATKENGVELTSYAVWRDMLKRCFSEKYKSIEKSYSNTTCCKEWYYFSKFKEDVESISNAFRDGYQLDKDLLGNGEIYSKETVCFLPKEINGILGSIKKRSSKYGAGIRFENGKYNVRSLKGGKEISLGRFYTLEEARKISKESRKKLVISLAEKYKSELDSHVYQALISYDPPID